MSDDSEDCSKVTVPLTFESPRRTATVERRIVNFCLLNDAYRIG